MIVINDLFPQQNDWDWLANQIQSRHSAANAEPRLDSIASLFFFLGKEEARTYLLFVIPLILCDDGVDHRLQFEAPR